MEVLCASYTIDISNITQKDTTSVTEHCQGTPQSSCDLLSANSHSSIQPCHTGKFKLLSHDMLPVRYAVLGHTRHSSSTNKTLVTLCSMLTAMRKRLWD